MRKFIDFLKIELEAKSRPLFVEKMATNGVKVIGKTLDPYFKSAEKQMHPKLLHFLSWKNFEKTGCVFLALYIPLFILHYFYLHYIVTFTLFALVLISIMFKLFSIIYNKCVPATMSDESKVWQHPLKPYIEKQTKISQKEIHSLVNEIIRYVDKFVKRSKKILFVDNLLESTVVWCISLVSVYCGTSFSALTLLRAIVKVLFIISLTFGYIEHKTTVDQICSHVGKRIQHGQKHSYKNHENSSAQEEKSEASLHESHDASLNENHKESLNENPKASLNGSQSHKASLSESVIMKFSSIMFFLHLELKMIYYLLTPIVISSASYLLLCLFEIEIPHIESVTNKRSLFNQMFVKFGWGWTLGLLLPFQFFLAAIYRNRWHYFRNIVIKTSITTTVFYVWCQVIFPAIEEFHGECKHNERIVDMNKRECIKTPEHIYMSTFDISGHAFLMSYCVLILMHEARQVEDLLKALREPGKQDNLVSNVSQLVTPAVAINFILITVLSLLWDFMIIITNIYFHTFAEILVGVMLAVLMFLTVYEKIIPGLFSLL